MKAVSVSTSGRLLISRLWKTSFQQKTQVVVLLGSGRRTRSPAWPARSQRRRACKPRHAVTDFFRGEKCLPKPKAYLSRNAVDKRLRKRHPRPTKSLLQIPGQPDISRMLKFASSPEDSQKAQLNVSSVLSSQSLVCRLGCAHKQAMSQEYLAC